MKHPHRHHTSCRHSPPLNKRILVALSCTLAIVVSGCTTAVQKPAGHHYAGRAHYERMAEPEGSQHYKLTPGQSWVRPALQRNPEPVYPPALVTRDLPPVVVVARLSVNRIGRVTAVYVSQNDNRPRYRQAFEQAVRDATTRWRFSPMKFTTRIPRNDAPPQIIMAPKPYSMWFKFRFDVVDGKPVTSSRQRR